jgi:hypothetical protein
VDAIHFMALRFKRISFSMDFLLLEPRKMSYLCIELNMFGTNLMLQLKISYEWQILLS